MKRSRSPGSVCWSISLKPWRWIKANSQLQQPSPVAMETQHRRLLGSSSLLMLFEESTHKNIKITPSVFEDDLTECTCLSVVLWTNVSYNPSLWEHVVHSSHLQVAVWRLRTDEGMRLHVWKSSQLQRDLSRSNGGLCRHDSIVLRCRRWYQHLSVCMYRLNLYLCQDQFENILSSSHFFTNLWFQPLKLIRDPKDFWWIDHSLIWSLIISPIIFIRMLIDKNMIMWNFTVTYFPATFTDDFSKVTWYVPVIRVRDQTQDQDLHSLHVTTFLIIFYRSTCRTGVCRQG